MKTIAAELLAGVLIPEHGKAFRHRGMVYGKPGNKHEARMDFGRPTNWGVRCPLTGSTVNRKPCIFCPAEIDIPTHIWFHDSFKHKREAVAVP